MTYLLARATEDISAMDAVEIIPSEDGKFFCRRLRTPEGDIIDAHGTAKQQRDVERLLRECGEET